MLAACISVQDEAQTERSKAKGFARSLCELEVSQSFLDACDGFLVSEKDSTPEELGSNMLLDVFSRKEEVRIPVCCAALRARLAGIGMSSGPGCESVPGHARWHRLAPLESIVCAGHVSCRVELCFQGDPTSSGVGGGRPGGTGKVTASWLTG